MVEVELISASNNPIETIWRIWRESKSPDGDYEDESFDKKLELVRELVSMDVPVVENVSFTFLIKGISVSWREQAVRHRVGTKVGDSLGVDIIPESHDSSYWSTSMRIADMSKFYDDNGFRMPESIERLEAAKVVYNNAMKIIQDSYKVLVESYDIPFEDARELIPLGATHKITWTLNLKAMKHIIKKRSCFILQSSLWHPVIIGMVGALRKNGMGEIADILVEPPCVKGGKFHDCAYPVENTRRIHGKDSLPVCPMYLYHNLMTSLTNDDINMMSGDELIQKLVDDAVGETNLIEVDESEFREKMTDDLKRFSKYWKHLIYLEN